MLLMKSLQAYLVKTLNFNISIGIISIFFLDFLNKNFKTISMYAKHDVVHEKYLKIVPRPLLT